MTRLSQTRTVRKVEILGEEPESEADRLILPADFGRTEESAELDLGEDRGAPPPEPTDAAAPQARPAGPANPLSVILSVILSAEALSVTGILVALLASTGAFENLLYLGGDNITPQALLRLYGVRMAIAGALTLGLGVGAIYRLLPDSPRAVRGAAGAATLLGLIMLVVAAVVVVRSGSASTATPTA